MCLVNESATLNPVGATVSTDKLKVLCADAPGPVSVEGKVKLDHRAIRMP
jgi:hypothetical protein